MDDVLFWFVEHGFWVGAGLMVLVVFLVCYLIVDHVRHGRDDGFEPLGDERPPPPRVSPFARDHHHP